MRRFGSAASVSLRPQASSAANRAGGRCLDRCSSRPTALGRYSLHVLWKQKRHSKGSRRGGRFARQARPTDVPIDPLQVSVTVQAPLWGSGKAERVSDLPQYISVHEYRGVAASQAPIADTAAEMWHSHSLNPDEVLRRLRGLPTQGTASRMECHMAQRLQQSVLDATHTEPFVVYRGVSDRRHPPSTYAKHLAKTIKPGQTIQAKGFWSSSVSPVIAGHFASTFEENHAAVLFRIETDTGKFLPASATNYGSLNAEQEVVLPHGGEYEVLGKETVEFDGAVSRKAVLISLRYKGTKADHADLGGLQAAQDVVGPDNPRSWSIHNELDTWLTRYENAGLPLGARTSLHPVGGSAPRKPQAVQVP